MKLKKKMTHCKKSKPNNIDGVTGDVEIGNVFADKAHTLYNSVSYDQSEMSELFSTINDNVKNNCCQQGKCYHTHTVTHTNVREALQCMKSGKNDGDGDFSSDFLINGTHNLEVHMSLLFTSILQHGVFPEEFVVSTIIPIPKNKRKSINCSSNYRGIALGSIICKLFDYVMLISNRSVFTSSDLQYGFKSKHSTVQCTFVVNEVIQYYLNGGSTVHLMLLDASKAFDRVHYIKLFKVLLSKGICPLVARILAKMYVHQKIRVKWNSYVSDAKPATNGVKQGGVISPILFTLYIDELFSRLKNCGMGCYIGNMFCGSFGYADDVTILAPTRLALRHLLKECVNYANEFSLLFNLDKSKYLIFDKNGALKDTEQILFNGQTINCSQKEVHLGNVIANNASKVKISDAVSDFYCRFNVFFANFKNVSTSVKYRLFKTYCMPVYGSQLWNYESRDCETFYTAWRKAVRRLLFLDPRTHNYILPLICKDIPVETQLHKRFVKFFICAYKSQNVYTSMCARLAIKGSHSDVSKSLTYICHKYQISKFNLSMYNLKNVSQMIVNRTPINDTNLCTAQAIQEFLDMRNDPVTPAATKRDLDFIISHLCTC
jgi:hypothetical protein